MLIKIKLNQVQRRGLSCARVRVSTKCSPQDNSDTSFDWQFNFSELKITSLSNNTHIGVM